MIISAGKRWKTLFSILGIIPKLPAREKVKILLRPLDAVRYHEVTYMNEQLKALNFKNKGTVLDISSPFVPAYLLSGRGFDVLKTDIDRAEEASISKSSRLRFELADGTQLTYSDNSFDLVYSISVIEHIYKSYIQAISEMIRVTKPGGLVYISFPISKTYTEEWLDNKIYSHQGVEGDKAFFQYRFDQSGVQEILDFVSDSTTVAKQDIYWEMNDGGYSALMDQLRKKSFWGPITFLKNSIHNFLGGFNLLSATPGNWSEAKDFGNFHIILRKK